MCVGVGVRVYWCMRVCVSLALLACHLLLTHFFSFPLFPLCLAYFLISLLETLLQHLPSSNLSREFHLVVVCCFCCCCVTFWFVTLSPGKANKLQLFRVTQNSVACFEAFPVFAFGRFTLFFSISLLCLHSEHHKT